MTAWAKVSARASINQNSGPQGSFCIVHSTGLKWFEYPCEQLRGSRSGLKLQTLLNSCFQFRTATTGRKTFPKRPAVTPVVNYYCLTQAQTQTLSRNVLLLSLSLHPSYNNMHKQIQSELESLPEPCPPYGKRREKKQERERKF